MASKKINYIQTVTGVTSGTDLNNLSYYINGNTKEYVIDKLSYVTNAPANIPTNYPARLFVIPVSDYACQVLFCYTAQGSPHIYIRQQYYSNGNKPYSNWYEVYQQTQTFTITALTNIELRRNSTTTINNLVAGSIVGSANVTSNQWIELFAISPTPKSAPFKVPVVATSDGTYLGMAEFTDTSKIRLYPKQTKNGEFSFTFAYAF